ncbi:MAG: flagellar basal-body MS-ring/collar protein FliF [Nitrospiria bacterium]
MTGQMMTDIVKEVKKGFTGADGVRKIILSFALAGGLASMAVVWLWLQKPSYQILYSNLSAEDAGAVVTRFKELKVSYQLSPDGTTVLVPAERVHELRMQLASQGLPQGGGIGFEIFDQSSFGTTEFVQKLNLRRALQGELGRTISQISAIKKARVHLVVPERALFSEQQEKSSAAVVVNINPGQNLSKAQINGITHLVSSSVEGLEPQSVTVVDSRGQVLSTPEEPGSAQGSDSRLIFQANLEKDIEKKVRTMLERVVGNDKAVVRVSSVLDFRQIELTEERFDPDIQVVRSEQKSQEKLSGSSISDKASGVPGVSSNIPQGNPGSSKDKVTNQNQTQKKNEVINYEINKTISRIVEPTGSIKRLSVAVLIDGTYEDAANEEGETLRKYIPRTEEEMKKLEGVVKKAMGYSPERNDQVEVVNFPLETNSLMEDGSLPQESTTDQLAKWLPIARYLSGPIFALLIFMMVIKPILKALTAPLPPPLPLPSQTEGTAALPSASLPQQLQAPGEDLELDVKQPMEDPIKLAKENPQVTAQIVKKWLKDS